MDKVTIAQLNLHNDRAATSELDKLINEYNINLVLVQEQYQRAKLNNKLIQINNKARAGIYVSRNNNNITVTAITNLTSTHCAVAEISSPSFKFYAVSCYFQFSDPVAPHIHTLRNVLHALTGSKIIVGADVNASSPLWHGKIRSTDADRRSAVEDFIAEMNLVVHNTPEAPPTYSSPTGESSIDVTLSSVDVSLNNWRVLPDASCSDHRLIVCEFAPGRVQLSSFVSKDYKYKTRNANWNYFSTLFDSRVKDFMRPELTAVECAELMTHSFVYCADVTLGRGPLTKGTRCDWWNDGLAKLRRDFRRARRKLGYLRKRKILSGTLYELALNALRVSRSHYRAAVERSKGALLQKVVARLDKEGPWSPLYHEFKANKRIDQAYISNIKIGNSHTVGVEETADALLNALIPDDCVQSDTDYHREIRSYVSVPPLTPMSTLPSLDEFMNIVRALPTNKASGEDKISNKMIKAACETSAESILSVYTRCIAEGTFPGVWRTGFIRIIPKSGNKPPDDPKSYRPITLLPSLGKLLERLIVPRLLPDGPKFHERQFGFTIGRSTVDAALSVRELVEHSNTKYVLGIFLDISGAFDNAWWPILLLKLKLRGCNSNIYSLIHSYFMNGSCKLRLGHHAVSKVLTQGCPQGSVISPYLWNIGFDDFFDLPLPEHCSLTGYADDGLLLIHANTRSSLELHANDSLRIVSDWGVRNRLTFAPHKTYQLLLKGNLQVLPRIKFNSVTVAKRSSVCYLGLLLDKHFNFIEHMKQVGEKAKNNFYALTRISNASWGLSFNSLKIIYNATYLGCITYGSPAWADRATIGAARRILLRSQRLALIFLCKAYRTVSTEALPVLAGVIPVDLEIQRRASMYYISKGLTSQFLKPRDRVKIARLFNSPGTVREDLLSEWQSRWDTSIKGRHLFRFFPSVRDRLSKPWMEIDHCVSQFLTGHGNFKAKLFSFKLVPSPLCECSSADTEAEQTAHHILWECRLWHDERKLMLDTVKTTSGAPYYSDLVATRTNYHAFRRFCYTYHWTRTQKQLTH
jgi:hypothetical protein